MARNTIAKKHRADAERAAEHYLHEHYGCTHTVRAVRTQWQRQDLFASDVIGKGGDGDMVFAQVTCGREEAVRTRRRKLEAIPWHPDDRVLVLQLVERPNPANARRKDFYFRVHKYMHRHDHCSTSTIIKPLWVVGEGAVPVPRAWFRAWKAEDAT